MHPSRTAPVDVDTLTRVQQLLTRVPTDQAVPSCAGASDTDPVTPLPKRR
jgi:hypothetical protein